MSNYRYHDCGGTILVGGVGEQAHRYCDRCGAFTHDMNAEVPTGTDEAANRQASDNGEESSPDAESAPMKIMLDASFDLHAAGFDNSEENCEAFEAAYIAKAAEMYPEVTVVRGQYQGEPQGCDTSEEATEIWQAIHDAVQWAGARK